MSTINRTGELKDVDPLELSDAALAARLKRVDGGYAGATIRGVLRLPNDKFVFVKRGTTDFTIKGVQCEAFNYTLLRAAGYNNMPEFIAANSATLIIEDLSGRDFSSDWSEEKLKAAMDAMHSLADIDPPADLKPFELPNGWNDLANDPQRLDLLRTKMGDQYDPVIEAALLGRAQTVDAFLAGPGIVSHGDVRGDNFGYDPDTQTGLFVDWNWTGTAPESKDPTELLISVAESGYEVTDDMLREHCSKEACLMLAGYWFAECTKPAWEGGEKVREHQFISANIAWEWYKRLATETSDQ